MPIVKRLSNKKELQCFVPHTHIGSSTERGLAGVYCFCFGLGLFLAWGNSGKASIHSATQQVPELGLKSLSSSFPEGSQGVTNWSIGEKIVGPNGAGKGMAFIFLPFQFCINLFSLQYR